MSEPTVVVVTSPASPEPDPVIVETPAPDPVVIEVPVTDPAVTETVIEHEGEITDLQQRVEELEETPPVVIIEETPAPVIEEVAESTPDEPPKREHPFFRKFGS